MGRTAEDGVVKSMAGLSGTWDGACTYDVREIIGTFASLPPPSSVFLGLNLSTVGTLQCGRLMYMPPCLVVPSVFMRSSSVCRVISSFAAAVVEDISVVDELRNFIGSFTESGIFGATMNIITQKYKFYYGGRAGIFCMVDRTFFDK